MFRFISQRIKAEYGLDATNVGDEGGFAPNIESAEKGSFFNRFYFSAKLEKFVIVLALDILVKAIDKAGYKGKIQIGMDVAASEFFDENEKKYDLNNKQKGHPNYVRFSIEPRSFFFSRTLLSVIFS